jgi:hypothetical protein
VKEVLFFCGLWLSLEGVLLRGGPERRTVQSGKKGGYDDDDDDEKRDEKGERRFSYPS